MSNILFFRKDLPFDDDDIPDLDDSLDENVSMNDQQNVKSPNRKKLKPKTYDIFQTI